MAVLFLFFGDWKGSLVVGISMPLSVLLAVIVLNFIGYDMNVLTGTGLILAIGMIVDNSIVILESCSRYRAQGLSFQEAAAQGTSTAPVPRMGSRSTKATTSAIETGWAMPSSQNPAASSAKVTAIKIR